MDVLGLSTSESRRWLIGVLLTVPLSVTGCAGLIGHLGYWSGASLTDPEYAELAGRRVAVICVADGTSYGAGTEERILARQVSEMLEENVEEIDIVRASEVADWVDKNGWNQVDYREVGRGVKAERVVAIDLTGFRLREDQTLYKARAELTVTVFDMTDKGREAFRRSIPEITYPAIGFYSTSDTNEATFRQVFLNVLARRAARHFFAYDELGESTLDPAAIRSS
jgi:hypothetical protein